MRAVLGRQGSATRPQGNDLGDLGRAFGIARKSARREQQAGNCRHYPGCPCKHSLLPSLGLDVHSSPESCAVFNLGDFVVGSGEHIANDLAVIRLVFDQPECACSCGLHLPLNDHWKRERKCRTLPRLESTQIFAVHLNDTLRYGEAQAGATLLAGDGVVGLLELLEQPGLVGSGDAGTCVAD